MRRYSPPYYSPPRRGYGGRGRSPPRRGSGGGGGYGRHKDQNNGSLLVRNIPLDCRPEELRVPFERFGVVRDVYLPKDYYTGEPRGFAFVQFVDSYDAAEAQYQMNGQYFAGREISVVLAAETRKRPEEMRKRSRVSSTSFRGPSGYGGRRPSHYGRRSRSFSRSRSRSPLRRYRSRSYSPAPKRRGDYSVSPDRRHADPQRSPRDMPPRRGSDRTRRSYSPDRGDAAVQIHSSNGHSMKFAHKSEDDQSRRRASSPGRNSRSPSGSRSRSADFPPGRNGHEEN